MRREQRLSKGSEFTRIFKQGKTWAHSLMVLKALPNGLEWNRFGFAVSKKVGNAVVRNRVRRQMREVARSMPLKTGWDLVFIARDGVAAVHYGEIEAAMKRLLERAYLLLREQG
jgi:ribonuclease P protein component